MMNVGPSRFADPLAADKALSRVSRMRESMMRNRQISAIDSVSNAWFIIRVAPQREADVRDAMTYEGVECWRPVYKRHSRGGRRGVQFVPKNDICTAFGGYLFVRIPRRAEAIMGVMSFEHVVSFLGNLDGPKVIANQYVKALMDDLIYGGAKHRALLQSCFPRLGEVHPIKAAGVLIDAMVTGIDTRRMEVRMEYKFMGTDQQKKIALDAFLKGA